MLSGKPFFAAAISVPGVYVGLIDKMPFGAAVNKGLTIKTGQTHVQRYGKSLLEKIEAGQIDPSFIITHRVPLEEAPDAYKTFRDKEDGCIKVVSTFRLALLVVCLLNNGDASSFEFPS
jgi:threonine dehydrogenase-like Zn-dependent dehydrogenase